MRWLKRIAFTLVAIVALLLLIGLLLPSGFKVQRSILIAAPAAKIYPLIADPRQWKNWGVWNRRDPAMAMTYAGADSGAGAKWSWQSKTEGNGEMEFMAAVPDERIDYVLTFPEFGMSSRGQLRLEPEGAATRVTWTNEGDMGANPINRYFALMMDRMVGPDFEAGLANLKGLAEKG
jgi:uncharacterized protein YndB with AHSA1/START domain